MNGVGGVHGLLRKFLRNSEIGHSMPHGVPWSNCLRRSIYSMRSIEMPFAECWQDDPEPG